jgi:hypothetical protein
MEDIFLRDRLLGTTERVSLTNWGAASPAEAWTCDMTPHGRWVVFASRGRLVAGDSNGRADVYVRDRYGFADVPYAHWARLEIEACVEAGVVQGYDPDTYAPEIAVTRDQMAVFISRSICTPTGEAGMAGYDPPDVATFNDVPTDQWAYKYIEYCVAEGVVQGFDPVTYGPTVTVSRDQMSVFISRAVAGGDEGVPGGPPAATFDDVPTDHWAYKYVEYCIENGVVSGYGDGLYHPERIVTRDQMAVYVARGSGLGS